MRYELECGHCGYQFVLDAAALPRTTKCAVCGGVLAIARPLSIAPPVPPPPPEPREPVPPTVPAPALGTWAPEVRAQFLAPPWLEVRFALNCARPATNFAAVIVAVVTGVTFVLLPGDWPPVEQSQTCLGWLLLLPAAAHVAVQWRCTMVPRTHGQAMANASLLVVPFTAIGAMSWLPGPAGVMFTIAIVVAAIVSFAFWLAFLTRLGLALGDDALALKARSSRTWFPFALVLVTTLLAGAVLAARIHSPVLVWIDRIAAGAMGFVLLRQYSALLRTAVNAIDTRAPVELDR